MINMSVFDRSWFLEWGGGGGGEACIFFLFFFLSFPSLTGLCMSVFDVY